MTGNRSKMGFLPLLEEMEDDGHTSEEGKKLENSVALDQNLERFQSLEESFEDLGESFQDLEGA